MTAATNPFFFKVVVRRVTTGAAPFAWEVHRDENVLPLQVSADRFGSMEAAYLAGQAKLADIMVQKRSTTRRA
ncbi:MAG TPA: hypothetical protein VHO91_02445 [Rhodopila sp.]|nr:hypothetical protein [Rhodopila sp.]